MKATNPKINGLILAGGYSRRMGQDKALLKFNGKPQIENAYELLQKFCAHVFISIRNDQPVGAISNHPNQYITDALEFTGHGPISGILSAMKEYPEANWLILACDLPFVTEETIETLIKNRDPQKTATAFLSSTDNLPEPLCAIWEGRSYNQILKLFQENIHCPRKILLKSTPKLIPQPNPKWLTNINTPEEYNQHLS